jgi:hypothetical protein
VNVNGGRESGGDVDNIASSMDIVRDASRIRDCRQARFFQSSTISTKFYTFAKRREERAGCVELGRIL